MNSLNLKIVLLMGSLIFVTVKTQAQEYPGKDSVLIVRSIAADFGVPESRAAEIRLALNFNNAAIDKVILDKEMDQKERSVQLRQLLEERRAHINATLTAAEKEQLKNHQAALTKSLQSVRENMEKRRKEKKKPTE